MKGSHLHAFGNLGPMFLGYDYGERMKLVEQIQKIERDEEDGLLVKLGQSIAKRDLLTTIG